MKDVSWLNTLLQPHMLPYMHSCTLNILYRECHLVTIGSMQICGWNANYCLLWTKHALLIVVGQKSNNLLSVKIQAPMNAEKGNKWLKTQEQRQDIYQHITTFEFWVPIDSLITGLAQVSYGLLICQAINILLRRWMILSIVHFNKDPELEQLINGDPVLGSIFIEHPLFHSCSGQRCQHVQHLQCILLS